MSPPAARVGTVALAMLPFLAISAVHLGAKLAGAVALDQATKGWTVPALALGAILTLLIDRRRLRPRVFALLFTALGLSWLGDITLADFVVGLSFFLVAHLAYIVLFHLAFHRNASWWSLGLVFWFAGLMLALWPSLGALAPVVAVYGVVLGLMAAFSTRGNTFTMIGGTLFVASDSLLAFRLFTPLFQTPPEDTLIMAFYLAAQLFLVIGVLRTATAREPRIRAGA
ncbi:lysoplasmalogenase [Protaetiibacter larvae]|uniref:Lysoplasmalogenase n=1 Tax=Protaetiibacter larvae TaxID=2592654 RepID=A0A5C1Y8A2_9MICO|nr:lysoplasmalogenase [Protaetiibacter larvae]QEO10204.1 lysoplasmalogenase [Protaetiibacter larvae]